MHPLAKEILAELSSRKNDANREKDKRYHKYPGHESFGITTPDLARILREYRKKILLCEKEEVMAIAKTLFEKSIEESILAGNYLISMHQEKLSAEDLLFFDRALEYFCSWSTIDNFCIDVLHPFILKYPDATMPFLRKWSKSPNLWKRRASVVAFTRKAGASGRFTNDAIKICESLLDDDEDLVKKGVGWALKDLMKGEKKTILPYISNLRKKGVSSTIILYAIRDLKDHERQNILDIRPQKNQ